MFASCNKRPRKIIRSESLGIPVTSLIIGLSSAIVEVSEVVMVFSSPESCLTRNVILSPSPDDILRVTLTNIKNMLRGEDLMRWKYVRRNTLESIANVESEAMAISNLIFGQVSP